MNLNHNLEDCYNKFYNPHHEMFKTPPLHPKPLRGLKKLLKRFKCFREGHELIFLVNISEENIKIVGGRSIWKCESCEKVIRNQIRYFNQKERTTK